MSDATETVRRVRELEEENESLRHALSELAHAVGEATDPEFVAKVERGEIAEWSAEDARAALERIGENDRTAMVRRFFEVVAPEQERLPRPGLPSAETLRLRVDWIAEEFVELLDAVYDDRAAVDRLRYMLRWFPDYSPFRRNLRPDVLPDVVDALVDIAYTAEGMLVACGVDGSAVFRLVHVANLAKEGGPIVDGKRRKPAGWIAPDVVGELRRQGWSG